MNVFDPKEVLKLMNICSDAYETIVSDEDFINQGVTALDRSVSRFPGLAGWLRAKNYLLIEDPKSSARGDRHWGVVGVIDDTLVAAFRGTALFSDVLIDFSPCVAGAERIVLDNFSFATVPCEPAVFESNGVQYGVHREFLRVYLAIRDSLRGAIRTMFERYPNLRNNSLVVTGHSLGGALAQLAAFDLSMEYPGRVDLLTFASPRISDRSFTSELEGRVKNIIRYVNYARRGDDVDIIDPVPPLPGVLFNLEFLKWFYGHSSGPKPTRTVETSHAGVERRLIYSPNLKIIDYLTPHFLSAYYRLLRNETTKVVTYDPQHFYPGERVLDLKVVIKTEDELFAGTDADVYVNVLGVEWGPLDDAIRNDFEQDSLDTFSLYDMFPDKIPRDARVQDMKALTLDIRPGFFNVSGEWKPRYLELYVNYKKFVHVDLDLWMSGEPGSGEPRLLSWTIQADTDPVSLARPRDFVRLQESARPSPAAPISRSTGRLPRE